MKARFSFEVDISRNLVRMTMAGFFEPADVQRFVHERDKVHTRLLCGPNEKLTLVDVREMDMQSQEAVALFAAVLANPSNASKRIAFVVTRSLSRMQLKRAAASRTAEFFTDNVAAAEAWLSSDEVNVAGQNAPLADLGADL